MLKKKSINFILLVIGLCLVSVSLFLKLEEMKSVEGIMIGLGAGLIGMSIANIYMRHLEERNPEISEQNNIELKDERNIMIRNKAKAKAADVTQWLIMGIAYITIIINAPLWVTVLTVAVFLIYNVAGVYYMNKYQKEM
ncbi:hypothetical protein [Clostridium sp.]|uniref:hypothetical protein n=1 Tax=Clostridium sp. TaxID=1506 RepID=UPI002FC6097F